MEARRRQEAEKEAAARRATERQTLENAEQLVTASNERQAKRMPMLLIPRVCPNLNLRLSEFLMYEFDRAIHSVQF
jgi:hypothetical protein